jgi:hypothetical protein
VPNPLDALDRVINKTVAPNAAAVDRDALQDFVGRAVSGLPLLGPVA